MTTYKKISGKITKQEKKQSYMILSNEEVLDLIRNGIRVKSKEMFVLPS